MPTDQDYNLVSLANLATSQLLLTTPVPTMATPEWATLALESGQVQELTGMSFLANVLYLLLPNSFLVIILSI